MAQFGLSLFNDFGYLVELDDEGAERQPLPPCQGYQQVRLAGPFFSLHSYCKSLKMYFFNKLDYN